MHNIFVPMLHGFYFRKNVNWYTKLLNLLLGQSLSFCPDKMEEKEGWRKMVMA